LVKKVTQLMKKSEISAVDSEKKVEPVKKRKWPSEEEEQEQELC